MITSMDRLVASFVASRRIAFPSLQPDRSGSGRARHGPRSISPWGDLVAEALRLREKYGHDNVEPVLRRQGSRAAGCQKIRFAGRPAERRDRAPLVGADPDLVVPADLRSTRRGRRPAKCLATLKRGSAEGAVRVHHVHDDAARAAHGHGPLDGAAVPWARPISFAAAAHMPRVLREGSRGVRAGGADVIVSNPFENRRHRPDELLPRKLAVVDRARHRRGGHGGIVYYCGHGVAQPHDPEGARAHGHRRLLPEPRRMDDITKGTELVGGRGLTCPASVNDIALIDWTPKRSS